MNTTRYCVASDPRNFQRLGDKLVPRVWCYELEPSDGWPSIEIGFLANERASHVDETNPDNPHCRVVGDALRIDL
jgi:hypothetical protein